MYFWCLSDQQTQNLASVDLSSIGADIIETNQLEKKSFPSKHFKNTGMLIMGL